MTRYYVLDRVDEDRFMEAKTFQNIFLIRVADEDGFVEKIVVDINDGVNIFKVVNPNLRVCSVVFCLCVHWVKDVIIIAVFSRCSFSLHTVPLPFHLSLSFFFV